MTHTQQLEMLVDGLQLLAAEAEEQVKAVPDYACVTDEVISTFCDAYLLVPQLQKAGIINDVAVTALKAVDDYIERMPIDDSLADTASLESHPFWAEARNLASNALHALGMVVQPLVLRHVMYTK